MSPVLVITVNYGIPLFTHPCTKSFSYQTPSPATQDRVAVIITPIEAQSSAHESLRKSQTATILSALVPITPTRQRAKALLIAVLHALILQSYLGFRLPTVLRYMESELFNRAHLGQMRS